MKRALSATLMAAMGCGGAAAQAYQAGDWIFRTGAVTVAPNEDSDPIGQGLGLDQGVSVSSDTQLSLIGTYMFSDKFGLELLAATPFEHDIGVRDLGIDAGSVKHLPPTLILQWYPRSGKSGWQPYLGAGLNYTYFFDGESSSSLESALGSKVDLDLDDSFGLAAQVGVDIPVSDHWSLNAAIWYLDIDTTAELKIAGAGKVKFDVDIDPWVYNIGIAYKF